MPPRCNMAASRRPQPQDRCRQRARPAAPATEIIKDTTTAGFAADVIRESRQQPVLVDFWAPWCGPCKQLTPALEKAVRAAGGKVKLVKMNIDEHPSIAGQLGIQSIPAVIAFKNGQPVDGFMGAIPESQIRDFLEKVIGKGAGAELADALAAAAEARAAGDTQTAADIYSARARANPRQRRGSSRSGRPAVRRRRRRDGAWRARPGARGQAGQPCRCCRARQDQARRRGSRARQSGRIRGPARQGSERSRGALRPCGDPECARQARPRRRTICWPSSRPTAPGARTPRGSSCCSSSRHGVRPTRSTLASRRKLSSHAVLVSRRPADRPVSLAVGMLALHIDYDVRRFRARR